MHSLPSEPGVAEPPSRAAASRSRCSGGSTPRARERARDLGDGRAWLFSAASNGGPRHDARLAAWSRAWRAKPSSGWEPALGAREICGKTRLGATDACNKKLAKEAGVCQHTDKAGKKMRKKCKITCGLCDEVSPMLPPPRSTPAHCEQKVAPDQHPCKKLAKQKKPSKIQRCARPEYQRKCAGQCDPECPLGYSFLVYAARPAWPNAFAEDGVPPPCQPCRARDYRNGAEYSDGDYFDGTGICRRRSPRADSSATPPTRTSGACTVAAPRSDASSARNR